MIGYLLVVMLALCPLQNKMPLVVPHGWKIRSITPSEKQSIAVSPCTLVGDPLEHLCLRSDSAVTVVLESEANVNLFTRHYPETREKFAGLVSAGCKLDSEVLP